MKKLGSYILSLAGSMVVLVSLLGGAMLLPTQATVDGREDISGSDGVAMPTQAGCPPATINGTLGSGSPDWPSVSGNQTGRLNRNGISSTCAAPKACLIFTAVSDRAFDAYTFTNNTNVTVCITVGLNVLTQMAANYQSNAYLGSYDPANICTNYLADPGLSSGSPPTPTTFSFDVPAGMDFVIVVHTTNSGEIGGQYELTLSPLTFCDPGQVLQDQSNGNCVDVFPIAGTFTWRRANGQIVMGTLTANITGSLVTFQGQAPGNIRLSGGYSTFPTRPTGNARLATTTGAVLGTIFDNNTKNNDPCP